MCGGIGVGGAQKHISVAPCGGVVAKPLTAEYRESMATKENLEPWQRCSSFRLFRLPLARVPVTIGREVCNARVQRAGVHQCTNKLQT